MNSILNVLRSRDPGGDLLSVLQGAGSVFAIQVGAAVLNYGTLILLAHWMGAFELGIYVFAWSWAMFLPLLASLGFAQAAVRFVPEYRTQGDQGRLAGLMRRSAGLVLACGLGLALAGWTILAGLGDRVPDYYVVPMYLAIACVPVLALVALISQLARGFGWATLAYAPGALLRPGLLLAGAGSIAALGIALDASTTLAIGLAASLGTLVFLAWRFRGRLPAETRSASPTYQTGFWLRVSLPLFLTEGVFLMMWNADTVMLGIFRQPADVAIYNASIRTAGLTFFFFNAVAALAAPKFTELYNRDDIDALQSYVVSIARWIFLPSAAMVLGLFLFGHHALGLFGADFTPGFPALMLLGLGHLSAAVFGPSSAYLIASGHQDRILVASGTAAIANVAANAVLIPAFGFIGAAVATFAAMAGMEIWLHLLVRRHLGIRAWFIGPARARAPAKTNAA